MALDVIRKHNAHYSMENLPRAHWARHNMFWKLKSDSLQSLQRPVRNLSVFDVSSSNPCHGDGRLAFYILRLFLHSGLSLSLYRGCGEVHLDLKLTTDVFRHRTVLEFDRYQRVELSAFDESRDEGVSVYTGKIDRVDTRDGAKLGEVWRDELLVRHLDLDVVVYVALLELVRVDEGGTSTATAADSVAFNLKRSLRRRTCQQSGLTHSRTQATYR